MSTNYVPQITFERPDAEPRVMINTAAIADGAVPVTRLVLSAGEDVDLNTDGTIVIKLDDPSTILKVGDFVKVSGVTTEGYTGLNGKTLRVSYAYGTGPGQVTLRDSGYFPESRVTLNSSSQFTLQLGYSYVEFFGFKAVGVANADVTLVGPSSAACLQPLGLGTKDGYATDPVEGRTWNLQDWYFKVAADGDGVMMLLWK